jgi:thiol-disulfide isomerase/thioredoxin
MADESFFTGSKHVLELHPKDYVEGNSLPWKLKSAPGGAQWSAVMYYASWCGHCIRFKDTWESLYRVNGCMKLCAFNCAKYDAYYRDRLNFSEYVRKFPSIVFYKGADPVETYQGSRDPPEELVKTMLMFCKSN